MHITDWSSWRCLKSLHTRGRCAVALFGLTLADSVILLIGNCTVITRAARGCNSNHCQSLMVYLCRVVPTSQTVQWGYSFYWASYLWLLQVRNTFWCLLLLKIVHSLTSCWEAVWSLFKNNIKSLWDLLYNRILQAKPVELVYCFSLNDFLSNRSRSTLSISFSENKQISIHHLM